MIGLIGGIGGGKSRVASVLRERGWAVIDADLVGHEVLKRPAVIDEIERRFGSEVIRVDDVLAGGRVVDRKALGAIVFADIAARHDLESIVHPIMRSQFESDIERAGAGGVAVRVVLDAAILLEAGWDDLCDRIIFVNSSERERLERVVLSRGWTREAFELRQQAQWSCERKRNHADFEIDNDSDVTWLEHEVDRLEQWLERGGPRAGNLSRPAEKSAAEFTSSVAGNGSC